MKHFTTIETENGTHEIEFFYQDNSHWIDSFTPPEPHEFYVISVDGEETSDLPDGVDMEELIYNI